MARIKDFTLTTTLAGDDYLPLDGATNGTRSILSANLRAALGLGTAQTPAFAGLTATGEIRTANTQALVVRNAADNAAALRLSADASNNAYLDAAANTELRFQVGSATKMTLGSAGNLWVEGAISSGRLDASINTDATESALANLFNSGATTAGRISVLNFGKSLNAGGGGRLGYHSDTATPGNAKISLYHYGDNASTQSLQIAKGGNVAVGQSLSVGGNVNAGGALHTLGGSGGPSVTMSLNGAAGQLKFLVTQTGGVDRWYLGQNSVAESGSNAGSNFQLVALTDAGTTIDTPILVARAAGGAITLARPLAVTAGGASTFTGNLVIGAGSTQKIFSAAADITVGGNDTVSIGGPTNRLYQVFTNRIGASGQTLHAEGNLSINGTAAPNVFAASALNTGTSVSTNDAQINVGQGRSGSGNAFIDLIGDTTYTDFGLRIRRHNTGANAASSIDHRGTGTFSVNADDGGSIALNAPTTLRGTATNDNAAAGYVGEFLSATLNQGSAVALTDSTGANVTSLTLTAGDWEVQGIAAFIGGSGVTVTQCGGGITTSSGVFPTPVATIVNGGLTGTLTAAYPTIPTRFSVASTATVYLVAIGYFGGGTLSAYGYLRARRVR